MLSSVVRSCFSDDIWRSFQAQEVAPPAASVGLRVGLAMSGVAAAMRIRANEVEQRGMYIGFFEWLVFSVQCRVDVLILFGRNIVNVAETFAARIPRRIEGVGRVAAVRIGDHGRWLSAISPGGDWRPDANHFVIGVAGKTTSSETALGPLASVVPSASARREAMKAHWVLLPTDSSGDCGLDCMSHILGQLRARENWDAIRGRLAGFIRRVADDEMWQDAFRCCQEMPDSVVAGASVGGMGPPAGSSSGSSSSQAPPTKVACKTSSAEASSHAKRARHDADAEASSHANSPGNVARQDAVAEASSHDSSTVAGSPPRAIVGRQDAVAEASSQELSPAASSQPPPMPPPPVPTFGEWLHARSQDTLEAFTKSIEAFSEAEKQWKVEFPLVQKTPSAARQHRSTKVRYRLAVGLAFLKWRSGAGRDSKAQHKDSYIQIRSYASILTCMHAHVHNTRNASAHAMTLVYGLCSVL